EVHPVPAHRLVLENEATHLVARKSSGPFHEPRTMGTGEVTSTLWPPAHRTPPALAAKLLAQKLVELSGIGFSAGCLHDLADEEAEERVLVGAELRELRRVLRHHLLDGALDGGTVGDLAQPLGFDHGIGAQALRPHEFEHLLGDLARDRGILDAPEELAEARRGDLPRAHFEPFLVE